MSKESHGSSSFHFFFKFKRVILENNCVNLKKLRIVGTLIC